MNVSLGDVLFVVAFGVAALGLGVAINNANFSDSVKTYCNLDYCINSTPLHFEFCEDQGYLQGFSRREWSGFYSSDPVVVERCREIWKFLEDSRGDGSD